MGDKKTYKGSKNALVLTGGGARAAYQVGVLSAITKFIPRNHGLPFPIICGTSAGAINATALACYASCFHLGVKKLEWMWKNLHIQNIYHSDPLRVFAHISHGILGNFQADYAKKTPPSLLNNAPLRALLNEFIHYERIDKNILNGYLSALSITASSYSSGDSISFFQSDLKASPWFRAKRHGEACQITSEHLLASAAIPLVFPSVKIRSSHFGDGSVHQLSPLSPAIHLGAKRLFVIGVEQPNKPEHSKENNPHPPGTATIAGHLLDTIFTDTMQSDIERMSRINNTLSLIPEKKRENIEGLTHIDHLLINPSRDFNSIAAQHYDELPVAIKLLLKSVGINRYSESSIVSYLLFEKNYCNKLIKLGFADAMEQEGKIRAFLSL
jgi:NTE family protein